MMKLVAIAAVSIDGVIGIEVLPKPDDYFAAKQAIQHVNVILNFEDIHT